MEQPFTVICNKCGSKNVYVSADTFFEPHFECKDCDNYVVGDYHNERKE